MVAYGRIIKPHLLDALPMVNLHYSLLPRWRGAAPVERAILAGDTETGVDVMRLEEGLDTGGIYAEERVPIGPDTTADELRATLTDVGCRLLVDVLDRPLAEWIDTAVAAGRRHRVRSEARQGRVRDRLVAVPPSRSIGWCGSAAPGRRSGASG